MNELEEAVRKCVFDELCVFCTKRVYIHCEYMNKKKNEPICKEGKVVYDKFISGVQWQAKQSTWISVEERLPEKDGLRVWVKSSCLNEQPLVYWKGKFYARLSDGAYDGSVTHWTPIPE